MTIAPRGLTKLALLFLLLPASPALAAPPQPPEVLGSTAWRANNTADIAVDFAGRVIVNHGGGVDVRSLDGTRRTIFEASLAGPRTRMTTTPDGRVIAVAKGGVLRRFDHEGRELGTIPLEHGGGDIALSADGTRVAALDGATVRVVSTKDGKTLVTLVGAENDRFDQVAFAPDGKSIAASSSRNGVRVWSLPSGAPMVRTSPYPKGGVSGDLAFGADGTLAVRGWSDLVMWPAGSTTAKIGRPGNGLGGLAACGADKFLAMSDTLGLVLIAARSGTVEPLVPNWKPSSSQVAKFAASADCARAALALGDGSVRLIDVPNRRILAEPTGHLAEVLALTVLPDGRLASGGEDGTVRIWRGTQEEVTVEGFTTVTSLTVHAGDLIVATTDKKVTRVTTKGQRTTHKTLATRPLRLSASPHGELLVGDREGNVRVLDATTFDEKRVGKVDGLVWHLGWVGADAVIATQTVHWWRAQDAAPRPLAAPGTVHKWWNVRTFQVLGDAVLTNGDAGQTLRWTSQGATLLHRFPDPSERELGAAVVALVAGGKRLVTLGAGFVSAFAVRDGVVTPTPVARSESWGFLAAVSPDGRRVWVPVMNGAIELHALPEL
jgi:WD40 repeat protein